MRPIAFGYQTTKKEVVLPVALLCGLPYLVMGGAEGMGDHSRIVIKAVQGGAPHSQFTSLGPLSFVLRGWSRFCGMPLISRVRLIEPRRMSLPARQVPTSTRRAERKSY